MSRKKYVLLKETPELYKGAILEEMCDDGTQNFHCITKEHIKKPDYGVEYGRETVMKQPKWFAEVNIFYLTKEQIKKVAKYLKK